MLFLVVLFVIVLAFIIPTFLDHLIYGQTPAPPITASTSTLPNPNLQYLPQPAFVQTYPPNGISSPSISSNTDDFSVKSIVSSAVTSAAAYLFAKRRADSHKEDLEQKRKEDLLDILTTKQQTQELAKYTFSIDPEKAKALENADKIKLCNLEADVNKTAEKAAKS